MAKRRKRVRTRRLISYDRVRTRLYNIVLDGEDYHAIAAARVLLGEKRGEGGPAVDAGLLAEIAEALGEEEAGEETVSCDDKVSETCASHTQVSGKLGIA